MPKTRHIRYNLRNRSQHNQSFSDVKCDRYSSPSKLRVNEFFAKLASRTSGDIYYLDADSANTTNSLKRHHIEPHRLYAINHCKRDYDAIAKIQQKHPDINVIRDDIYNVIGSNFTALFIDGCSEIWGSANSVAANNCIMKTINAAMINIKLFDTEYIIGFTYVKTNRIVNLTRLNNAKLNCSKLNLLQPQFVHDLTNRDEYYAKNNIKILARRHNLIITNHYKFEYLNKRSTIRTHFLVIRKCIQCD